MRYALVPVKKFSQAKKRLSPLLTLRERRRLAAAMLDDVVGALEATSQLDRIAVVTSDGDAQSLADRKGVLVVQEDSPRGLTEAAELGISACLEHGATSVAVIPGDIPLVTSDDIDCIMRHGQQYEVVIVPSWNSRGTNTILLKPPNALQLQFGSWSFYPHVKRAKRAGLSYKVLRLPHIALDVDTPDDLARVAVQASGTHCYDVLKEMDVLERIQLLPTRKGHPQ